MATVAYSPPGNNGNNAPHKRRLRKQENPLPLGYNSLVGRKSESGRKCTASVLGPDRKRLTCLPLWAPIRFRFRSLPFLAQVSANFRPSVKVFPVRSFIRRPTSANDLHAQGPERKRGEAERRRRRSKHRPQIRRRRAATVCAFSAGFRWTCSIKRIVVSFIKC